MSENLHMRWDPDDESEPTEMERELEALRKRFLAGELTSEQYAYKRDLITYSWTEDV